MTLKTSNKQLHYFRFAFLSNKNFETGTNGMEIPRASFQKIRKLLNFLKENHSAIGNTKKKSENFGESRKTVLFSWNFLISCCTRHLRFSKVHIEIFSSHGKCPLVWKFSVTTGTVFPRIFEKGDNLKKISEMSYPEFLFHVIFLLNLRNFRLNSSGFRKSLNFLENFPGNQFRAMCAFSGDFQVTQVAFISRKWRIKSPTIK